MLQKAKQKDKGGIRKEEKLDGVLMSAGIHTKE